MCTSRISVEKTGFDANGWISTARCAFLRHMCRSSVQTFRTIILFYNSFSTSMIQFIPNVPVNVNLYSLQRSSAQLPVAVRGKVSVIFSPWRLQLRHHFSRYLQSKTVNDEKQVDWTFLFVWKTSMRLCIAGLGTRSPSSLLGSVNTENLPRFRIFQKANTLQRWNSHCPQPHVNKSDSSVCFFFVFFYTICYCRGSQLLRPSLVHLFTGWLASCLSLGRLREMTTHGL